jgi:hypothetical protein
LPLPLLVLRRHRERSEGPPQSLLPYTSGGAGLRADFSLVHRRIVPPFIAFFEMSGGSGDESGSKPTRIRTSRGSCRPAIRASR